jgi:hypothetical protein
LQSFCVIMSFNERDTSFPANDTKFNMHDCTL